MIAVLARHATSLLAVGIALGLVLPDLAQWMRPALSPAIWILLVVSALRVDVGKAVERLRSPLPVGLALCWLLVISPILCWGLVNLFDLPTGLAAALVLMAGGAPLMSTPALARILGLDDTVVMITMIAATLLVPFSLPIVALYGLGFDLGVDPLAWSIDLTLFVGSAIGVALGLRRFVGPDRVATASGLLDLAIVVLLLVFAVAIMDGVTDRLLANTSYVLWVVVLAFLSYVTMLVLTSFAFVRMGLELASSIGFAAANRNVGVTLAVLPAEADPDILLYFAIWQMPMYMMPALLKKAYPHLRAS